MISIYDSSALEVLRSRNAVQPHRMKLFRNVLFKHFGSRDDALDVLPEQVRYRFGQDIGFQTLELAARRDSVMDGASKLIFKTADGHHIESVVLRPKTGRIALCISSQVGCACSCSFCATGQMGFSRNLTTAEILDQVMLANRMLKPEGRTVRNVVFMGMGEPFLNLENLFQSLRILCSTDFFNYSGSRLMVSTVGIPSAMKFFTEAFPDVKLALSLHSARQEVRESLMPQARSCSLESLHESLVDASAKGKVMVEYLMLEGVNDEEEDFRALEAYLLNLPVHINIITFNEFEGCDLCGSALEKRSAFADRLKAAGFHTTLRYSLGADIAAACGQLVQQKWVKK